jgi:chromosome segregation ATPase
MMKKNHNTSPGNFHTPVSISTPTSTIQELKKQLHAYREAIIERDATINDNKNQHALAIQQIQYEHETLKRELTEEENVKRKILKDLGTTKEENQNVKHKIQMLQRETDQLTIQREKDLNTISDLQKKYKEEQEKTQENSIAARRLEVELNEIANKKSQLEIKSNSQMEIINDLKRRMENVIELQEELRTCKSEIVALTNKNSFLSTVERELKDAQDEVNQSKMACATLEGRLLENEKKNALINHLKQKIETLQQENNELQSKTHTMSVQAKTLRSLEEEVSTQAQTISSLNDIKEQSMRNSILLERKSSEVDFLKSQMERNSVERDALQDTKIRLSQKEQVCNLLEDQLNRLTEETIQLREELDTCKKEIIECKEKERVVASTYEMENNKLQSLQKETQNRISQAYKKAQEEWDEAESKYESDIAENEEEIRSLRATVASLQNELNQSNHIRESANERCQKLESEVNKLHDDLNKVKDESENALIDKDDFYRKKLDSKHEDLIQMQSSQYEAISKSKTIQTALENEKKMREEERSRLENLLKNLETDLKKLKENYQEVQDSYTHGQIKWATEKGNLQGQIAMLNNKIDMLTTSFNDAKDGVKIAQESTEEMRTRAEAWKKEQTRLKVEIRELNQKYEVLTMEKLKYEDERRIHKDNIEAKDEDINILKSSFEQLKSNSTISIKNLESLVEKKELQLKTTNGNYQSKVDELTSKYAKLQNKSDLLEIEKKNLENTYEQYKNDVYDYKINSKKEKTELVNENNDLRLKLEQTEIALNDCKKQLVGVKETFQTSKVNANNEIVQLRHNIETLTKDLSLLNTRKNEMKVGTARLEENNKSLGKKVGALEKIIANNKRILNQKEKELQDTKHQYAGKNSQLDMKCESMQRELNTKTKILNDTKIEYNERVLKRDLALENVQKENTAARRALENKITDLKHQLKEKEIYHESMRDSFEKNINEAAVRMKKKEVELNELRKKYDTTHAHHTNLKLRVINQLDKARVQLENSESVKRNALLKYEENEKIKYEVENRYNKFKLEMDEVKATLRRQLKHAKEEEKVLRHELNQSQLSINDLKHRVEAAEISINKYKAMEAKYENICREYEESRVEISSLKNQLWNANEKIQVASHLKKRLDNLNDDHRKLTEDLTVKNSTIINLEEKIDKNARLYKSKLANYDIETERVTRNMQIKVDDTYDMYNRVVEESSALREQLLQCRSEIDRLKKAMRELSQEKDEIILNQVNKITALADASTNARDAMKEMQQRMSELQHRLGEARKEVTVVKVDSEFKENELNALKKSINEKNRVNNSLVYQLDGIQEDFREFLSRSSTLITPPVHSILNENDTKRLLALKTRTSRINFSSSNNNHASSSKYGFQTQQLLQTHGLSGVQARDLGSSNPLYQKKETYPVLTPGSYMDISPGRKNLPSGASNRASLSMSELRKEYVISPGTGTRKHNTVSPAQISLNSTFDKFSTTATSSLSSSSLSPGQSSVTITPSSKLSGSNKKMRRFSDIKGIFNTAVRLKLAKDLKDVFHVLDKDHNHSLNISELQAGLKKMFIKIDDVELKQLWIAFDLDEDDKISFDDFEQFCQKKSLASQAALLAKDRGNNNM